MQLPILLICFFGPLPLARFIKPKEWGWRFLGADIQMANGQLVECYGRSEIGAR